MDGKNDSISQPDVLTAYGKMLSYDRQYKKSLSVFQRVLSHDSAYHDALVGRGYTILWSGKRLFAAKTLFPGNSSSKIRRIGILISDWRKAKNNRAVLMKRLKTIQYLPPNSNPMPTLQNPPPETKRKWPWTNNNGANDNGNKSPANTTNNNTTDNNDGLKSVILVDNVYNNQSPYGNSLVYDVSPLPNEENILPHL